MSKKLIPRIAKLLSETKKNKSREIVAIAYEHIPRNPLEQKHGSLYAVIELEDAGGYAEEIVDTILDILHREFYADCDKDSLASFESALAKINEDLAERSSQGQINWLGKLNAVLAALSENTLHLTQAGKSEAFLYRGEQMIHITEDLAGDSINPLRTFINIASGDLTEGDRLALVTPGVFLKLSKNELKRYVTENSPKIAINNLSQILEGQNQTTPNAVLIIEIVSPEIVATEPEADISPEQWLTQQNKKQENLGEKMIKNIAGAIDFSGKLADKLSAFFTENLVSKTKNISDKFKTKIKSFRKEKDVERIIIQEEPNSEETIAQNKSNEFIQDEIFKTGPVHKSSKEKTIKPGINEYRIREEEEKPRLLFLERFNFSPLNKIRNIFSQPKVKYLQNSRNKKVFIVGSALIIIVLSFLVTVNTQNKKVRLETENKYSQAKTKYENSLNALVSGNRILASQEINTALKLAIEAKNSKYKISGIEELISNIESTKNQIEGIIKNTAQEFFNFGKGRLDALYSDGKIYYTIKNENASVYALDPISKTMATIIEAPSIDGKVKDSTFIKARKVIVILTEKNSLYEIDLIAKKITKQNVISPIDSADAIDSFFSNIYILSKNNNQIFKYPKITAGYGRKTSYFVDEQNVDLSSALDFAIDANIYVLKNDSLVEKYTSGKLQSFNITGLPEGAKGANKIFASPEASGLLLYNKDKIIKIDEKQNFEAQFISDSLKNISAVLPSNNSSKILALSEGKIYTITY